MGCALGNAGLCLELSKLIGYYFKCGYYTSWCLIEQILYMFSTVSIESELN